jgi:hypothetical protein
MGRRAQGMDITPWWGLFTGNSDSGKGLWRWDISLYGSSVRGTWKGTPFLGALIVTKGRLWGWGLSSATWSGLIYRGLWDMVESGSKLEKLSLWELCDGGSFAGGPEGHKRKALGMSISLHGGSVGQHGVGSSTRDFEI